MQVTLRKADQLAKALKELGETITVERSYQVNIHDLNWKTSLATATQEASSKLDRLMDIQVALAGIRAAVGRANNEAGINDLLAEDNMLKARIGVMQQIAESPVRESEDTIAGMIAHQQKPTETSRYGYGNDNVIVINGFAQETLKNAQDVVLASKKRRRAISDDLISKNVSTKVTLTAEIVKILTTENLI